MPHGEHPIQRLGDGSLAVDQGEHHGFPVSYNPDDDRFYVHAPGVLDGTEVLATFKSDARGWANAMQFARLRANKARADAYAELKKKGHPHAR